METPTSALWTELARTLFADIDDAFIVQFRAPGGANSRLAAWDPFDRSMRYYKLLLFHAARRQPERFFTLYRALGRVDIGAPVAVTLGGCAINIDYLLAIDEILFLETALDLGSLRSIVEIGAGFGRTAHALLTLAPEIERYTIVDLAPLLALSRRYLSEAVPAQFHKLVFVAAEDSAAWQGHAADLALNIDSFQEMLPTTIAVYMAGIVAQCRHFYVKNPIGKYRPESVGLTADPARLKDVFALGYCRGIIDIFDETALAAARPGYVAAYRPGAAWKLLAEAPLDIFPYLHHALYRRG